MVTQASQDSLAQCKLISAASLVPFCGLMREFGIDGEALMRRHHLHPQFVQLPSAQVRYDSIVSLLDEAATATGCSHIGVLLGARMPVDVIDLFLLAAQTDTLGDALANLQKYQRFYGTGFGFELYTEGDVTAWRYSHNLFAGSELRTTSDLVARALIAILKMLLSDALIVDGVSLDYPKPEDPQQLEQYQALFGCPCKFESPCIEIRFATALLDLPMAGNKRVYDIMLQHVEEAQHREDESLREKISRLIYVLLPTGRCCIENIADILGVHRRTLQKKLKIYDIKFKDILRDIREERAFYLLNKTDLNLQDIANSLGYSETANFLHAFKRWTGQTPSVWRKQSKRAA